MAVRLSDAFIPQVYADLTPTVIPIPELTALLDAGVLVNTEQMNLFAKAAGKVFTFPAWLDIDPSIEQNYSNDDPADLAVPNKIGSTSQTARKSWVNQAFSSMDLVAELAGSNPLSVIKSRFDTYWQRRRQRRLIAMLIGLMNNNIANNSSDMVVDISGLTTNNGLDAHWNASAFINGAYQLGDFSANLTTLICHSQVVAGMVQRDEIVNIQDSTGSLVRRTYKEKTIIMDDNMPKLSGSGVDTVYMSVLLGTGAVGFGAADGSEFAVGEGNPEVAAEVVRTPLAGHGGGMEALIERKTWVMHPIGFNWVEPQNATTGQPDTKLAEMSPSDTDLKRAVVWSRAYARKQIPMVFFKTKA